jgi:hypothetical protein
MRGKSRETEKEKRGGKGMKYIRDIGRGRERGEEER